MKSSFNNSHKFEGTSHNGDLLEALSIAISRGQYALKQDFLNWELVTLKGQYGGIIGAKMLTAIIRSTDSELQAAGHTGEMQTLGFSEALVASVSSGPSIYLRKDSGPVWLDLTVSTLCLWNFVFEPHTTESQPPNNSANRQSPYAQLDELIGKPAMTWTLTIINQTDNSQDYKGKVRLVQGQDIGSGKEVYSHDIEQDTIDPATKVLSAHLTNSVIFLGIV